MSTAHASIIRRFERGRTATTSRLLRRWQDDHDRAADAVSVSDDSLARYDRMLAGEATSCDVPCDLLRAICWYASGWRHFEPSGRVLATPRADGTAWGCMQLSDHWHPDAFPAAQVDPAASIRYAASLLDWLHEQTGSWPRATVAFFGHAARAEHAARRVRRYQHEQPWKARLEPIAERPLARGPSKPSTGKDAPGGDLYADLVL